MFKAFNLKRKMFQSSKFPLVILFCLMMVPSALLSQEEHNHEWKNRAAFFTGTSMAPTMLDGKDPSMFIFVPTYGLEYERKITPWMALGVLTEIELENYVIEKSDGEVIDRSFVYVGTLLVLLKTPVKHLIFYFGPGYELASEQNFSIFKIGIEYDIEIGHNWGIAPDIAYDRISNVYRTFTFGIAIGKKF